MFVPHYSHSWASWHIQPVVIRLHYYDNKSCYENFPPRLFLFFEPSAGCNANFAVILSNDWVITESGAEALFADTMIYEAFSLPINSAPVWPIWLLWPWIYICLPLSLKPQLNSSQCRRTWNIPQSQSVIQADKTARRTKRKRINEDYWHRVSHLPVVMFRQNILLLFRPSTVSAVTSGCAAAKHW